MASDPANASFKWLVGEETTRPGDVLITFKGGARLSVRPTFGCKRCGGSGSDGGAWCKCIRDVCESEARKSKEKWQTTGVDFSAVGQEERARVLRLEVQMAQIRAEKQSIEAQSAERRERHVKVIEEQRTVIKKADEDLKMTTKLIGDMEEGHALLEKQKAEIESFLRAKRKRIMEEQNAAMRLSSDIRQAQATAAESETASAAIAAGKYGERYEKLTRALTKREVELVEARKKVEALDAKQAPATVEPVPEEQTDKTPQPQGNADVAAPQP